MSHGCCFGGSPGLRTKAESSGWIWEVLLALGPKISLMDGWMCLLPSGTDRVASVRRGKKVFTAFLSPAGLLLVAPGTGFVDVSV